MPGVESPALFCSGCRIRRSDCRNHCLDGWTKRRLALPVLPQSAGRDYTSCAPSSRVQSESFGLRARARKQNREDSTWRAKPAAFRQLRSFGDLARPLSFVTQIRLSRAEAWPGRLALCRHAKKGSSLRRDRYRPHERERRAASRRILHGNAGGGG
jgi:hypothetical protein